MYKVNIFVTNDCNAKVLSPASGAPGVCDFCFRPIEKIETNDEIIKRIVNNLDGVGLCEPITLTGGEPLVSKHIYPLIDMLIEKNHSLSLHTNGILLAENEDILKKIKYISLPYDGDCAEIADYYRGKGYYQISQKAYELAYKYNLQIGLHTLVTPHNINRLVEMGHSLESKNYSRNVWYWFIKRFKKINHALSNNTTLYDLDEQIYRNSISIMKQQFSKINIIESGQVEKEITTLFIALDGNVFIYRKGQIRNQLLGNIINQGLDSIISCI